MIIKTPIYHLGVFLPVSLLMGLTCLNGKSIVLPVEAIEDAATMKAEEFNQKHQGIDVSGYYPDDPGYYIGYTHENLTYYFGPLEDYPEAANWKYKLDAVREEVIYERPTLASSETVIYNFTLETIEEHGRSMQEEATGNGSSSGEFGEQIQIVEQGQDGQSGNQQEQGQKGSESGGGQEGVPILQIPGEQGQQSGESGSSGNSGSSAGGSSGGGSSSSSGGSSGGGSSSSSSSGGGSSSSGGGGGGGKPSWWEMIKGIFGG